MSEYKNSRGDAVSFESSVLGMTNGRTQTAIYVDNEARDWLIRALSGYKELESSRHRSLVEKYCRGNGVDLGCGPDPINLNAIRVDRFGGQYCTNQLDNLPFKHSTFDYVHASHILEDFADWKPMLMEWSRILASGGYLIIAVPDHELFRAAVAGGQPDNLDHKHESYLGEVETYLPEWKVMESKMFTYSIVTVLRKP